MRIAALDTLMAPTAESRRQILDIAADVTSVATESTELDAWTRMALTRCAQVGCRLFPRERLVTIPDRFLPYVTGAKQHARPRRAASGGRRG
jgi:hypothetical protein